MNRKKGLAFLGELGKTPLGLMLGIGLAVVKGLAEMHGGSVEPRSAGLGYGSEFVVTLPIVAAELPAA